MHQILCEVVYAILFNPSKTLKCRYHYYCTTYKKTEAEYLENVPKLKLHI